jgi:hypothetical protein
MADNEEIANSKIFDFDKWTYNVLREDVENDFFRTLFQLKSYRTRYWISAVRKGPYMEKRHMELLCFHYTPDGKEFRWLPAHNLFYPVKYWGNSREPINLLQRLRAKHDVESLPESLVFCSDDL